MYGDNRADERAARRLRGAAGRLAGICETHAHAREPLSRRRRAVRGKTAQWAGTAVYREGAHQRQPCDEVLLTSLSRDREPRPRLLSCSPCSWFRGNKCCAGFPCRVPGLLCPGAQTRRRKRHRPPCLRRSIPECRQPGRSFAPQSWEVRRALACSPEIRSWPQGDQPWARSEVPPVQRKSCGRARRFRRV